jgi:hypothetical protein
MRRGKNQVLPPEHDLCENSRPDLRPVALSLAHGEVDAMQGRRETQLRSMRPGIGAGRD